MPGGASQAEADQIAEEIVSKFVDLQREREKLARYATSTAPDDEETRERAGPSGANGSAAGNGHSQ